jgi:replicative DNA helicase
VLDNLSDQLAEEKAVAASLLSPEWAGRLDPTSIVDAELRKVADGIAKVVGSGADPTPYAVATCMADVGQMATLEGIAARHGTIDAATAFGTVREMRLRRECAGASKSAYEGALDLDQDIVATISKAEGSMACVGSFMEGKGSTGVQRGGDFKAVRENFDWRVKNPGKIRGMTMGFPELEQMLDGIHRKKSYIIGARPAVGKSALGKDITQHFLLEGRRVLNFTLEMGADEYRERLVSSVSKVPTGSLRVLPYTTLEIEAVHAAFKSLSYSDWHIDDTPALTVDQLRRKARSVSREGQLDLIVIDYIQLMRGSESRSQKDRRLEVGEISSAIKQLAKDLDVPIISLAQLKRASTEVYDRDTKTYCYPPPKITDLKEAGNIEEDADAVILISRDGPAELLLAKNRNGPCGSVSVEWIPELCQFKE